MIRFDVLAKEAWRKPLERFIAESNRIEGITSRPPRRREIEATQDFLRLTKISIPDVVKLTHAYQPDAKLRDEAGLNVRVGYHTPRPGGPLIREILDNLLIDVNAGKVDSFTAHQRYERLHPFTDGNGRSGRAIWLWRRIAEGGHVQALSLGFLHSWYYQSLEAYDKAQQHIR